jgi:ABC-type nitrate/sulfonate/bicarbonate transport system substrate-binding protein
MRMITTDAELVSVKFSKKYPNIAARYIKALEKAWDDYRSDFRGIAKIFGKVFPNKRS